MSKQGHSTDRASDVVPRGTSTQDTAEHRRAILAALTGMIAHEVNNLMVPLVSYCELSEQNPDDNELARKALRRAREGALQATRVATAILGLAKGEFGGGLRTANSCDVEPIAEAAKLCLGRFGESVELMAADTEARVAAAAPIVQQVLVNLLLNARSTPGKGGKVSIAVQRLKTSQAASLRERALAHTGAQPSGQSTESLIAIEVRDQGGGFQPEAIAQVKSAFTGAKESDNSDGLGLRFCARMLRGVGGSLAIANEGGGARVTILLPEARAQVSAKAA